MNALVEANHFNQPIKYRLMKTLSYTQLMAVEGGSDDIGSWMPWNLISDLFREAGNDFGHWINGTYSGSRR